MINLIPPEGHRAVKFEYYLRVMATLSVLFSIVTIFLIAALVPKFILIRAQLSAFEAEMIKNNEEGGTLKTAEAEVQKVKGILTQLKSATSTTLASESIEELERQMTASIELKSLMFDTGKDGTGRLQVQGKAETREALAQFKARLEASPMFTKAEIPIADFARDVDLPFGVTITLAKKK